MLDMAHLLRRFKQEALSLPVKASGDSVLKISEYINYHWEILL